MSLRVIPACFFSSLLSLASCAGGVASAVDDLADLKPGTKVVADVGGESVGEVLEKVAPDVYRVRVKIRTSDSVESVLPIQRLRLAQGDAAGIAPTKPKADATAPAAVTGPATAGAVAVSPGTTTPGTTTAGTVTPGTVTQGTVTRGTTTAGTVTRGTVVGSVTVTPGTVTPGRVTPGTVTPGTVTQGTTPAATITQGTASPGTVTPGTVTQGTVTPGTATPGSASSGTVTAIGGSVTVGGGNTRIAPEAPIVESKVGTANLRSMVGVWDIVSSQRNGRLDTQAPESLTITPTSLAIGEQVFEYVRVDPTSEPRRIDIARAGPQQLLRGIYKREGDRLIICLADTENSIRPTDFTTTQNDGRVQYEYALRK